MRFINGGGAVVDVRDAASFNAGHIVDSVNIPEADLLSSPQKLAKNKKGTLLVCDTGALSAGCAGKLRKDGHENVFTMKGGLLAWQQENLPVVSTDEGKG